MNVKDHQDMSDFLWARAATEKEKSEASVLFGVTSILHHSQRCDPREAGDGLNAFVVVMQFTQGDAEGVFDGSQ